MSLENLLKINQLQRHKAKAEEVQRLLAAADRNLADSAVPDLSNETRFVAAYKAIIQCTMLGLMAHGYRPSTNIPVHHQTMIQSLGLTFLKLQHEHHGPTHPSKSS
jgi:shikimate 5-dehydrogenase